MHKDGLITLPPPKWRQNRPGPIVFGPDTEPPPRRRQRLTRCARDLRTVVRGTRAGKLWNEFVARHHYLGHTTLVGAQMRYAVPIGSVLEARARQLHRMDAATPAGGRQSEVPHPALDRNPQPRAPPRHRPPPPARGLDRALQHKAGADRDLRRNTAIHRRRLQGFRLDPCRNHSGTRAPRSPKAFDKPRKDIWLRPLRKDWRILNR